MLQQSVLPSLVSGPTRQLRASVPLLASHARKYRLTAHASVNASNETGNTCPHASLIPTSRTCRGVGLQAAVTRRSIVALLASIPCLLHSTPSTVAAEVYVPDTVQVSTVETASYAWWSKVLTTAALPGTQLDQIAGVPSGDSNTFSFVEGALAGALCAGLFFLNTQRSSGNAGANPRVQDKERVPKVAIAPTPSASMFTEDRSTATSAQSSTSNAAVHTSESLGQDVRLDFYTVVKLQTMLHHSDVLDQFHCPLIHQALDEIRRDPEAILHYHKNPEVMGAIGRIVDVTQLLKPAKR